MLFGNKYRWTLRQCQGLCGLLATVVTVIILVVDGIGPVASVVSGVSITIAVTLAVMLEKGLKELERNEQQRKSDQADFADLTRAAIQSCRNPMSHIADLTQQMRLHTRMLEKTMEAQSVRDKRQKDLENLDSKRRNLHAFSISDLLSVQGELLKSSAKQRQIHIELKEICADLQKKSDKSLQSLRDLEQCRKTMINIGIELASVAGDHPGFFKAASTGLNHVNATIETLKAAFLTTQAPLNDFIAKVIEAEATNVDLSKRINLLSETEKNMQQCFASEEGGHSPGNLTAAGGAKELEANLRNARSIEAVIEKFGQTQLKSEEVANRAITVIEQAKVAVKIDFKKNSVRNFSQSPESSKVPVFDGDLSPANERTLNPDASVQIEIAS